SRSPPRTTSAAGRLRTRLQRSVRASASSSSSTTGSTSHSRRSLAFSGYRSEPWPHGWLARRRSSVSSWRKSMSSELERFLRGASRALPLPDERATDRARRNALTSIGKGRVRTRVLALAGATIVAVVALGVTAGSLNAPTGTAAREPAVLGFVPEPG